jgi:Mycolic acid cyclopropane synthetase
LKNLWRRLWRRLRQFNWRGRAQKNAAHHYDLDRRLYALFLDADLQYSCGYFETPDQSIDDAQLAKKRHLAAKLLIEPRSTVLDIGSGWGGLGLYLPEIRHASVTDVTLAQEQLAVSRVRADEQNLSGRVDFRFSDYRDLTGTFERHPPRPHLANDLNGDRPGWFRPSITHFCRSRMSLPEPRLLASRSMPLRDISDRHRAYSAAPADKDRTEVRSARARYAAKSWVPRTTCAFAIFLRCVSSPALPIAERRSRRSTMTGL